MIKLFNYSRSLKNKTIKDMGVFFLSFFLIFSADFLNAQNLSPVDEFNNQSEIENQENNELEQLEKDSSSSKDSINPELQKNFYILESVRPHDLDPHTTSYSADSQVLSGLYEGLFSYNPNTLSAEYALATKYRISRDKLRWTFTIRDDAKFSNGEPITAESVRDSWIQLLETPNAPYASLLDIIKNAEKFRNGQCSQEDVGIYAVDEKTLSIHLEKPANYLPKVLCHSAFSVIHRNPTVYSGPFMLEDQEQYLLVLEKNPYYWDIKNTNLEQISFIQSNDVDENTFLYNTGVIDWVTSGNVNSKNILNKNAIQMNAEFGISYLFLKLSNGKPQTADISEAESKDFNPWDKIEFRQALLEATPWEELRKNVLVPSDTFVFPLTGYPDIEGFSYTDINEAKNLMQEARKKYDIPENKLLTLTMEIAENSFTDAFLAALYDAYAKLGIDLQIIVIPSYYYLSNIPLSRSDMFSYTWIGDFADPLAFLELFRGKSTLNVSGWKNNEFDNLLDEAATSSDSDRYNLLAKAEEILLDSGMIYPIYRPVSFNIIDTQSIGGWYANAFDLHPLKYLYKKNVSNTIPNIVKK